MEGRLGHFWGSRTPGAWDRSTQQTCHYTRPIPPLRTSIFNTAHRKSDHYTQQIPSQHTANTTTAHRKRYHYTRLLPPLFSHCSGEEVQGTAKDHKPGGWGRYEQHISGDIAYAAWQYWMSTGDDAWLGAALEPLLRGVAEFWASRVRRGADGKFHIDGVMPPDEYHCPVDDSVVTNAVAALSLRVAQQVCLLSVRGFRGFA